MTAEQGGVLYLKNRQRLLPIDTRLLRCIGRALLRDLPGGDRYDLGVYLVRAAEIQRLNESFLQHEGSTDVITFDYADPAQPDLIHGEIFICVDEAVTQARRFRTTWQAELVRYLIHGVLHLSGYDDRRSSDRRKMKRAEDRLLRELRSLFFIKKLGGHPPAARGPRNPGSA